MCSACIVGSGLVPRCFAAACGHYTYSVLFHALSLTCEHYNTSPVHVGMCSWRVATGSASLIKSCRGTPCAGTYSFAAKNQSTQHKLNITTMHGWLCMAGYAWGARSYGTMHVCIGHTHAGHHHLGMESVPTTLLQHCNTHHAHMHDMNIMCMQQVALLSPAASLTAAASKGSDSG